MLDLGTGVAGRLAQFAISRADQLVLVTTPEWVTELARAGRARAPRARAHHRGVQQVLRARAAATCASSSAGCASERLHRSVAIPYDDQLAAMLDTATYQLDALERTSRMAIKRLGLAVAEQLV